jgi:hypothetical protein
MENRKFVITVFLTILVSLSNEVVHPTQVAKRELSKYDNGGAFDFAWDIAPQHDQMRAKLREFVWQHWREKRMGRVVATFYSIEGDPTTYTFYVKSDIDGRWRVVAEYETECCWFYAMDKKKRKRKIKRGVEIYDVVVRLANGNSRADVTKEISEFESREPSGYRLRLGQASKRGNSAESLFL